jgi:hypothetical protein
VRGPDRVAATTDYPTEPDWFAAAREPLREINARLLELLAVAPEDPGHAHLPFARELHDLLQHMNPAARERAAACPYLLVDAGFQDSQRWARAAVDTEHPEGAAACFPRSQAIGLAHMTLTLAWSLVRSHRDAASLLLGVSPGCAVIIADLRLQELQHIASKHFDWIRPRWEHRPEVWRRLLTTAKSVEASSFAHLQLHGLHLFFGDLLFEDS